MNTSRPSKVLSEHPSIINTLRLNPSDPGLTKKRTSLTPTATASSALLAVPSPSTTQPLKIKPKPAKSTPKPYPAAQPIELHPEFNGAGDAVIVCSAAEQQRRVGFRESRNLPEMASPILAALLGPKRLTTPTIVSVDDNMDDMYAFLRLIRLGGPMTATASPSTSHSSSSAPATFTPTIAQYTGIHRLCLKYNGWYTRAVLDFHIELHAAAIVDSVGPSAAKQEVYALPSLAHAMQSVSLWVEVCDRLRVKRWWHALLNPWRMSGQDAAGLGPSVFSLVCILASVSSRAGLYSDLDELCVHYSEEGEVSVLAVARGTSGVPSSSFPCQCQCNNHSSKY